MKEWIERFSVALAERRLFFVFPLLFPFCLSAQELVSIKAENRAFPLVTEKVTASIIVDAGDDPLVKKVTGMMQEDVAAVTGKRPGIGNTFPLTGGPVVLVGSIDKSSLLQQLIKKHKIDVSSLKGKWEAYQVQVVRQPMKGIDQALVIAGSDRRGTAYGVMTLLEQIGVSPWHWWADIPVKHQQALYIRPGIFTDAPKVKYRGIFINDEAPALSGWAKKQFGGFNHRFYEKVFELMLRLKGNYLWPAMWGNAFYDDDSLNIRTAAEYGIVIGTSHHEPLMRAHDEWRRYGKGAWNFDSNETWLKDFWRTGLQRADNEKIVTIGMRGDGDEPMSRETATALLERIVDTQRHIIEEVTRKPASATPQLWALYKEVQDYYDKGMRVPDDVTLLLCDDNWGNIRRLPRLEDKSRIGGYGIYYHFDYVGGPRSYKWINTNNIARVWEQMHLAWEHNVRQIWIVNVGDIKPMELPISFFLDYAWDPGKWNEDNIPNYYETWAVKQFGTAVGTEVGNILRLYSQYSARRKPELLNEKTYSYQEWKTVTGEWRQLRSRAERMDEKLPPDYHDAYFQLVLYPVTALCNLHEMYHAVALNKPDSVKWYFENDSLLTARFHTTLAGGKWNRMMSQTHIGYTSWNDPPRNRMPALTGKAITDTVKAPATRTALSLVPDTAKGRLFYEKDGYIAMEADHYSYARNDRYVAWKAIPGIGKTGGGISPFPVTAPRQQGEEDDAYTAYNFYTYDTGTITLYTYCSPTLNFPHQQGLQYAVSIDDEPPQLITLNKEDDDLHTWERWVADNIIIKRSVHTIHTPGRHVLKCRVIDPGVVLQRLVIDAGGLQPAYLGPPETSILR